MGWNAMAWLGNADTSKLSNAEFRVLYRLCFRKNDENGKCIPSVEGIMAETGMARRPVFTALQGLEEKGWISRAKRFDGDTKRQTSNQYVINGSTDHHFPGGTVKAGLESVELRGAPERTPRGAPERTGEGAPERTLTKKKELTPQKATLSSGRGDRKTACPSGFWPQPNEGTKTYDLTKDLEVRGALQQEVERFVAYHQTRGNRFINWQQAWTSWVTSGFNGKDSNGNGSGNGRGAGKTLFRVGLEREAARRAGGGADAAGRTGNGGGDTVGRSAYDW